MFAVCSLPVVVDLFERQPRLLRWSLQEEGIRHVGGKETQTRHSVHLFVSTLKVNK